jgi:hypothetical protein
MNVTAQAGLAVWEFSPYALETPDKARPNCGAPVAGEEPVARPDRAEVGPQQAAGGLAWSPANGPGGRGPALGLLRL